MPDPVNGRDGSEDRTVPPHPSCPRCGADLNSLPKAARFCNRCGGSLGAAPSPEPTPTLRLCPRWLLSLWCGAPVPDDSGPATPRSRSQVLLAYGKSMFHLGWRYEHAVGARRNLHEAARCYGKAARLGDPSAMRRLNGQVPDSPSDEVPLPAFAAAHTSHEPTASPARRL